VKDAYSLAYHLDVDRSALVALAVVCLSAVAGTRDVGTDDEALS